MMQGKACVEVVWGIEAKSHRPLSAGSVSEEAGGLWKLAISSHQQCHMSQIKRLLL